MKFFEAYIHSTGALMVKGVPFSVDHIVDQSSPFVLKYLGKKQLSSMNEARAYFKQLNGGKTYIDMDEIKRIQDEHKYT